MQIVDRRLNPKSKSLGNRQRFLRRAKAEIREAIKDSLKIAQGLGGRGRGEGHHPLQEPARALFLARPQLRARATTCCRATRSTRSATRSPSRRAAAAVAAARAVADGEGQDEFTFTLTKDEFLDLFFDDLKLPNLIKVKLKDLKAPQAGARRLHHRRPAGPAQPHPHHAQEPRAAHGAAAPERRPRSSACEAELAAAEAETPPDDGQDREPCASSSSTSSGCAARIAYIDPDRPAVQPLRPRAQADHAGRHVLPDGCLGLHDRAAQGPGQALLHAAARVPVALLPRGAHRLHPPHQHGRRGRRGDVLPRHRDRRHGHLHRARRDAEGRARALFAGRLEHLRGAGVRRRQLPRRHAALPGAARRGDPAGLPVFRLHRDDARRALQRHAWRRRSGTATRRSPGGAGTSPCGGWRRRRTSSRCSTSCSRRDSAAA